MLRSLVIAGPLLIAPLSGYGAPAGVQLLPSGPSTVHFVVEVPEPTLRSVEAWLEPRGGDRGPRAGGGEAMQIEVPGYESIARPGLPALPVRVIHVAVPPRGEVRVTAGASGERVRDGVLVAPQPTVERGVGPRFILSSEAYAAREPRGGPRARLLDVSWMRNQRVARIEIAPAEYEPAARRLVTWSRLDVEVAIEPSAATVIPAEAADGFEPMYRELLVNYTQGRSWRRSAAGGPSLFPAPETESILPRAGAGTGTPSVFAHRNWIKIAVTQTGFFKVDFGQIRNLAPFSGRTNIPLDSLRLFTWPGVPVLAEDSFCDGCDYREVAIGTIDDGDGIINRNADAIYFFALGPSDWIDLYDPALSDTVFINNPYETRSYYYLTVSEGETPVPGPFQRIAPVSGAPGGTAVTPDTFTSRAHYELDVAAEFHPDLAQQDRLSSGPILPYWQRENWFWKSFETGGSFSVSFDAPGRDPSQSGLLRARLWGRNVAPFCPDFELDDEHVVDMTLNAAPVGRFYWRGQVRATARAPVTNLSPAGNTVQFTVPDFPECPGRDDRVLLAWFDVFYPRRFEPVNDELVFDSPAASGDYRFEIQPFTGTTPPRVFDVTDPYAPREMVSFLYETVTGGRRLTFQVAQTGRRRFRLVRESNIPSLPGPNVGAARPTSLVDLRNPTEGADYLVIFFDEFTTAADSLAQWRQDFNGLRTMTIPISALYDQFSGGRTDPAAIRNFLRTVYLQWPRGGVPDYVTLLGDGSNDFKNYLGVAAPGHPGALMPAYENNFDSSIPQQYATDDWMLNVDNPNVMIPDFYGGRLPVADAATALDLVRNKILFYERSTPFGEYRNRVMLIADDEEQADQVDPLLWRHLGQTTKLDSVFTPQHIDREYVYLHTYPDRDEAGSAKPEVKEAIISGITEKGMVMVNYIGHGSPFQVSDERVLIDTDVGTRFDNADRLPMFIAASCDIGRFNDPLLPSLGEKLVLQSGGGTIGVISATGDVYSNQNAQLNESLYGYIFTRVGEDGYPTTLSQALLASKSGSQNSQKYQLLGDAAQRLNLPRHWVEVSLWDSAGAVRLTELEQGRTVLVSGEVRSHPDSTEVLTDFEGVAALLVEDAAPLDKAPDCELRPGCNAPCRNDPYLPSDCRPQYYFEAGPIYRGDVGVQAGRFSGRFVVPMEARLGPRGRLRAYVSGSRPAQKTDAVGSRRFQVDLGTAPANDREGPRITLTFAGGATSVRPDAVLRVLLFDPSGILTTGHTLQNGIVVTIDENSTNRRDITASFRYAADSYQSGTALYQLENLPPGPHRIRVSAADNLAAGLNAGLHRSSEVIDFEVSAAPPLRIAAAYLFPNPTRSGGAGSGGHFVIDAPGDSVNALLRIYTVSGRVIRELKSLGGLGQIQIPWDGRDSEGDRLATGTYVFRVHVNAREADGSSSATQKDSADGRFVILDR